MRSCEIVGSGFVFYSFFKRPSFWGAPLCSEVFISPKAPKDPYRAYAIGRPNVQGVKRIHAVDFMRSTKDIRMSLEDLKAMVLKVERFNQPELEMAAIEFAYDFFVPSGPITTRFEFQGPSGKDNINYIEARIADGAINRAPPKFKPPKFEYQPHGSKLWRFLVEVKTPDGIVEIVFTKYVNNRHMETQAAAYAIHIAKQLGLEVESVGFVGIGYDI